MHTKLNAPSTDLCSMVLASAIPTLCKVLSTIPAPANGAKCLKKITKKHNKYHLYTQLKTTAAAAAPDYGDNLDFGVKI